MDKVVVGDDGDNWGAIRDALRRRSTVALALALAVGLLVAAVGAAMPLSVPTPHVSRAVLLIDQPRALAAAGGEGYVVKLSRLRAKYRDLGATSIVLEPLSEALGEPLDRVRATAEVVIPPEALVIHTLGRSEDADLARRVAEGLADELIRYVEWEQEEHDIPPEDRIELLLVEPVRDLGRVTPSVPRALLSAVVMGAIAAAATYLLAAQVAARRRG